MPSQIAHLAARAKHWRGQLLEFLFPSRCASCHRIGQPLCSECLSSVHFVTPPFCPRCSQTLRFEGERCFHCRTYPLHLSHIQAVAYHEGPLRRAVHAFKYSRRSDLAIPLAALLHQHILSSALKVDLITAVPLHPERESERGYNQAELLAQQLSLLTRVPYVGGLVRTRATPDQIGLDMASRHQNMVGAFAADCRAFRGSRVLIVDDVCTTGATLDACAVALESHGARSIYGLTVARPR